MSIKPLLFFVHIISLCFFLIIVIYFVVFFYFLRQDPDLFDYHDLFYCLTNNCHLAGISAIITHPFSCSINSIHHCTFGDIQSKKMEAISRRRVENICVFCGTSVGTNPQYIEAAQELGRVMAEKNMHLIYGGGNLGLMGTISKAVHDRGSSVLGIITKPLAEANLIGPSNGEELIVPGMSERLV